MGGEGFGAQVTPQTPVAGERRAAPFASVCTRVPSWLGRANVQVSMKRPRPPPWRLQLFTGERGPPSADVTGRRPIQGTRAHHRGKINDNQWKLRNHKVAAKFRTGLVKFRLPWQPPTNFRGRELGCGVLLCLLLCCFLNSCWWVSRSAVCLAKIYVC